MKKLFISLLLAISAILIIQPKVNASAIEDNYHYSDNITWTQTTAFGGYMMNSSLFKLNHETYQFEILPYFQLSGYDLNIFDAGYLIMYDEYGNPDQYNLKFTLTAGEYSVGLPDGISLSIYQGTYARLRLSFAGWMSSTQRQTVVNHYNNRDMNGITYNFDFIGYFTPDETTKTVAELPLTSGNPFVSDGEYGNVEFFNIVDGVFYASISYDTNYYLAIPNLSLSSLQFLEGVEKTFYYTHNNERFLYFQYGHAENQFSTNYSDTESTKVWKGYTIWNLTTNEVVTTNHAYVLTYLKKDSDDLFAYAYFTNINLDDLLSATVSFRMRYSKNVVLPGESNYTPWENVSVIMQKDEQTIMATLPSWNNELYMASVVATTVGLIISMIPGGQVVGISLALLGGVAFGLAVYQSLDYIYSQRMDQITKINFPSQVLRDEIESHYRTLTGNETFSIDPEANKLYQLYLGNFDKTGTNNFDVDNESFKYLELVWTSEGEVLTLSGEHIKTDVVKNIDWMETLPEEYTAPGVLELFKMFAIPVGAVLIAAASVRTKAFSDIRTSIALIVFFIIFVLVVTIL